MIIPHGHVENLEGGIFLLIEIAGVVFDVGIVTDLDQMQLVDRGA